MCTTFKYLFSDWIFSTIQIWEKDFLEIYLSTEFKVYGIDSDLISGMFEGEYENVNVDSLSFPVWNGKLFSLVWFCGGRLIFTGFKIVLH